MYIQHFGLAQYPFSLTPNTRYFLKLASHQRAFDFIVESLQEESCFTKITGEVGTGKTMLCRKALNALEAVGNRYVTAFVPNPVLDEESIMYAIAEELKLGFDPAASYYEILKVISEELIRLSTLRRTTVLFIDEAQAMTEESLEAIRLLTTIEKDPGGPMPLQIILFGQPELDELLQRPALRELNRDLSASYNLASLDRNEVEAYLNHRLIKAGYNGSNLFTEKAVELIFRGSEGIPRLINILAHKALMVAFGKGDYALTDRHIKLAIEDTESAQQH
ncbi:MAG: AAA family ATPase [SAR86 cluster bacterium]|uniref:AAA family ATPase n=1 Tax=SAR86 cluster bacterium TaxID=2030880 RepID=A0A2A4WYW3_9GAMM|nr:MAG: AAA family ATPase [SAR86 cluster bacterium]